jgi:hypothetical protein
MHTALANEFHKSESFMDFFILSCSQVSHVQHNGIKVVGFDSKGSMDEDQIDSRYLIMRATVIKLSYSRGTYS